MERIDSEIRRELSRFGAPGGMPELLAAWPESVGTEIARNAWPARVARDGTLHVSTSSSAWSFELTQLAPEIMQRLSERLGGDAPRGLRFAPGQVPEPPAQVPEAASPTTADPTAEELAEASQLAAAIGDEELREKVQRAAAASLASDRSGRSV